MSKTHFKSQMSTSIHHIVQFQKPKDPKHIPYGTDFMKHHTTQKQDNNQACKRLIYLTRLDVR